MSDEIDDGGFAFPQMRNTGLVTVSEKGHHTDKVCDGGLSARQYAAIKLRVPNSGTKWLDDMIRGSLRDHLAGQALAGLLASPDPSYAISVTGQESLGVAVYHFADATLQARKKVTP